jgi:hypothetical protein
MSEETHLDNTVMTSDSQFIALMNWQGSPHAGTRGRGCLLDNTATSSARMPAR